MLQSNSYGYTEFYSMASSYCLKEKNGNLNNIVQTYSLMNAGNKKQNVFVEHTEIPKNKKIGLIN